MIDEVFRQYDIRGKIGSELYIEEVYDMARALASYFLEKDSSLTTVAVGMDGRTHSPLLAQELCRGLQESGLNVLFIGVCPSPVLYFSQYILKVQAGVMITASHNTQEYNGFKICLHKNSIWGKELLTINELKKQKNYTTSHTRGSYQEISIIDQYINFLKKQFPDLVGYTTPFVIDCANGAAGAVIPGLKQAFGWPHCNLLYPEIDGTYPHHEADPTVEANMKDLQQSVRAINAYLGIGLDGDADRMAPVTAQGRLIKGDLLLALFAKEILSAYPATSVVYDIKCSQALKEIILEQGGIPVVSASGHSIIKNAMKKTHALLGGELSCHFFFNDTYFGYDDGIYSMLRLLRIIKNSAKSLDTLVDELPHYYATQEVRLECDKQTQKEIMDILSKHCALLEGARTSSLDGLYCATDQGWFLVRPSNTQSVICIRAEGIVQQNLDNLWYMLYKLIYPLLNSFPQKAY